MSRAATPRVLVVDDLAEIVDELVEMLGLADIPATGARTLDEAMARLEQGAAIRIVICDVRLSRESGLDVMDRICRRPALANRSFHYIFVTGDPLQIEQLGNGFEGLLLEKPVQPRTLIRNIESLLHEDGARG